MPHRCVANYLHAIEHRIFDPVNTGSNLSPARNELNLLQAKLSPRESIDVNPRKIPTIPFYTDSNLRLAIVLMVGREGFEPSTIGLKDRRIQ
jgi:hypothetical protein